MNAPNSIRVKTIEKTLKALDAQLKTLDSNALQHINLLHQRQADLAAKLYKLDELMVEAYKRLTALEDSTILVTSPLAGPAEETRDARTDQDHRGDEQA